MKKYLMILLLLGYVSGQDCTANDGTDGVELWGECFSIENTTELDLMDYDLSDITDTIPTGIGNLINLNILILSGNGISGYVPAEIGNLTNLNMLSLDDNALIGEIPDTLYNLTNLTHLDLGENQLSGSITPGISNLTNLDILLLDGNQLSGSIPPEIGSLTNLAKLYLNSNQLSDSIPSEVGLMTNLEHLNFFGNQLTGSVPQEIGSLESIRNLNLGNNQLSGTIPDSICNLVGGLFNDVSIALGYNQLCPPYPACLEESDIGEQDCGGIIPACNLGEVYVSEGHTSGTPEDYIEIYNSGDYDCSLEGFQLDDSEELDDLTFGNVIIPTGGYWLGYEDQDSSFTSGLSESGDIIVFADSDNNSLIVTLGPSQEFDGVQLSQSFDSDGLGCYTTLSPGQENTECITLNVSSDISMPIQFTLHQNYPNPFNPTTNLSYDLLEDSFVSITVYDLLGNVVNNLVKTNQSSGYKSIKWDANDNQGQSVSAGVYLYSIEAGDFRQTKKMILLK